MDKKLDPHWHWNSFVSSWDVPISSLYKFSNLCSFIVSSYLDSLKFYNFVSSVVIIFDHLSLSVPACCDRIISLPFLSIGRRPGACFHLLSVANICPAFIKHTNAILPVLIAPRRLVCLLKRHIFLWILRSYKANCVLFFWVYSDEEAFDQAASVAKKFKKRSLVWRMTFTPFALYFSQPTPVKLWSASSF